MKKRNREIAPIGDDSQQKNTKSRRRKNLMKKSYELSVLCGLEVHLIIYDPKYNKMIEYSSNPEFTHEAIHKLINPSKCQVGTKRAKELKRSSLHSTNYTRPLFRGISENLDAKQDSPPVDERIKELEDMCDDLRKVRCEP